jgi:hypothetical protein
MLVAALDGRVPFTPPIHDWAQDSPRDFQGRMLQIGFGGLEHAAPHSHSSGSQYGYSQSICSSSSMAPMIHQPHASNASIRTPSLDSRHTRTDTITDSSISTSIADQCAGYPLLDEVDGVLVQPLSEVSTPAYECVFWFLDCSYVSRVLCSVRCATGSERATRA